MMGMGTMSSNRRALLAGFAAALALVVAGCGGGGSSSSTSSSSTAGTAAGGGGAKLSLKADASGKLAFNKKTLSAPAGKVSIVMVNPSQTSHSVAIQGTGVNAAGKIVGHGGISTVSATLKPGNYTYFCTVPGHRAAGMEGTLTVN
jgi:plastocyanin